MKKEVVQKVSKKELSCVLPSIGKKSLQLRTRLVNSIENNLKFCKLKVIIQSPCKLNSLFRYKNFLKKKIRSDNVCRYTCINGKVTYHFTYLFIYLFIYLLTLSNIDSRIKIHSFLR